jgi:hypothetical protein
MSEQLDAFGSMVANINEIYINQIVKYSNQKALWLTKSSQLKHNECWSQTLNMPDPDCSICGGSGYYFEVANNKRIITCKYLEKLPHGFQGGVGDLHTIAGHVRRVDANMLVTRAIGNLIKLDDIIIFPHNQPNQIEYAVVSKYALFVRNNRPIGFRLMLYKQIGNQVNSNNIQI